MSVCTCCRNDNGSGLFIGRTGVYFISKQLICCCHCSKTKMYILIVGVLLGWNFHFTLRLRNSFFSTNSTSLGVNLPSKSFSETAPGPNLIESHFSGARIIIIQSSNKIRRNFSDSIRRQFSRLKNTICSQILMSTSV